MPRLLLCDINCLCSASRLTTLTGAATQAQVAEGFLVEAVTHLAGAAVCNRPGQLESGALERVPKVCSG
jgi:hypothetical protein